jgi:hypothetical protein
MADDRSQPPPLYIVMTSVAQSKGKFAHARRNIAIIKTDEETWPKMISERARGVVAITHYWKSLFVGTTNKSEYWNVLNMANDMCANLNLRDRPLSTRARQATSK